MLFRSMGSQLVSSNVDLRPSSCAIMRKRANRGLDSLTVLSSRLQRSVRLEIKENLVIVWYGPLCRRNGELRLAPEFYSERMHRANYLGLARPQTLPEASQTASSTSTCRAVSAFPLLAAIRLGGYAIVAR